MRLEAHIGGGEAIAPWFDTFAQLIGVLVTEMQRLGVATAEEIGIETLAERLKAEAQDQSSVVIGHFQMCAWARV